MKLLKIRCRGGVARRVKVTIGGKRVDGIQHIHIDPIVPGGLVRAQITCLVDLNLEARTEDEEKKA